MADEITQADRELLAAEYERNGLLAVAKAIRANRLIRRDAIALRAIAAARRQAEPHKMRICELRYVILKPDTPYVFTVDPNCKQCRAVASTGNYAKPQQPAPSGGEVVAKHWHEAMVRDAYSRGQVDGAKQATPPSAPVGVETFEDALKEYVEDYEFCGEDESGREGRYTPSDRERMLIEDAIRGWEPPTALAQQPAAVDAAKHWHDMYRKECRLRQDDAARYGQQMLDEEASHARTIDQRDAAEDALGRIFQAVTGREAEWSSAWGYADAIDEVEERIAAIAKATGETP